VPQAFNGIVLGRTLVCSMVSDGKDLQFLGHPRLLSLLTAARRPVFHYGGTGVFFGFTKAQC
jgi:hypothetical protein